MLEIDLKKGKKLCLDIFNCIWDLISLNESLRAYTESQQIAKKKENHLTDYEIENSVVLRHLYRDRTNSCRTKQEQRICRPQNERRA
ncbi:MAG: hypothetical protein K5873_04425 [Treponema sp.]|nr:hypothetical protein [Treponema sp.]